MAEIFINNFNCRYDVAGNTDGDVVVFINGIASPLESWNQIRAKLNAIYKTIAYDLRGQWYSELTPPPYTFKQMANDLKALLDALGVKKTHIVATSLGGEIALFFAVYYPEYCQSLVVIASVSEIKPLLYSQIERWRTAAVKALHGYAKNSEMTPLEKGELGLDFFNMFMPDVFSSSFIANHYRIIEIQCAYFKEYTSRDYFQGFLYLCDMFKLLLDVETLTDKLHTITCPALIIAGGEDIVKPPTYSKIIAEHIPLAECVIIPDAGHTAAIEKPDMISSMARGFIGKCVEGDL